MKGEAKKSPAMLSPRLRASEMEKKKRPVVVIALTWLLMLTAVASALVIAYTGRQDYMMSSLQRDVKEMKRATARACDEAAGIDLSKLLEQNPDCGGWIAVDNTHIDFPLVQATEERPASWKPWLI